MKLTLAVIFLTFFGWTQHVGAQLGMSLGFEFQAYPTGLIPGFRLELPVCQRHSATFRLGYNHIRHGDAGKHDDERGHGWGGTLGLKRYFSEGRKGWFAGVRTDVWFSRIHWTDHPGRPEEATGTTKIVVFQPTFEAGYCLRKTAAYFLAPALALGMEWNVKTIGSPTGEGPILLAGFTLGF